MNLKQKVMSGLRWTAGAKFLGQLITWGITLVIIRLLTPADYGLLALASVFVAFLVMLNELGLGAAVVYRRDLSYDTLRSLFGLLIFVSVFLFIVMAIAAPFIAKFYDEPRLVPLVQVLALQFLLMGFTVLPQSLLLQKMQFRKIAIIDFISAILGSITTLALVLIGYGVWALVWGNIMIRIVSMIGLNIISPFICFPRINMNGVKVLLSFSGYVTLSRILWYFYSRADILIIGKVLGKEHLGFYAVGLYIASLPMEKVSGIINQVAFPAFSSLQTDPGMSGQHFLKAVRVMSFFAFPVLWGISSIAPEFVAIFLGPKWIDAVLPLQIISLVIPLRMVSNLMNPAALGAGRADISFQNSLVAFILMPIAFVIGSFWGILGICLAWVFIFPLVFLLNVSRVSKIIKINLNDILLSMKNPFFAGIVMLFGIKIVRFTLNVGIQDIQKMIIIIGCGILIYLITTLIFNRSGLQEIRGLIKI
jgi:O-antigen/teichoic acid export membrane protein